MRTTDPSPDPAPTRRAGTRWPMERVLFAMAGTAPLLSAFLAAFVSPWFLLLPAFVGLSRGAYVLGGACPASLVLQRFGVEPQCRW